MLGLRILPQIFVNYVMLLSSSVLQPDKIMDTRGKN